MTYCIHQWKDANVEKLCSNEIGIQEFFENCGRDIPAEKRQELFYHYFHDYFHDHSSRIPPDWLSGQIKREDRDERLTAFYESIYDAIVTDQEDWCKKGLEISVALMENNATKLLIALCGWSALSLAKRALLMCGSVDYNYEDIEGKLMVEWSDGMRYSSPCVISCGTHEVYNFNPTIFERANTPTAQIVKRFVRFDPFETGNEYDLLCVSEEERKKDNDADIFWYASIEDSN